MASSPCEEFLELFLQVEDQIRSHVKEPSKTNVTAAVAKLKAQRPNLPHLDDLGTLIDIRNVLAHNGGCGDALVVPTNRAIGQLREFQAALVDPRKAGQLFKRTVEWITGEASLGDVLRLIHERDYSQFPVASKGSIVGLVTEHSITRHLAQMHAESRLQSEIGDVKVSELIDGDAPNERYRFVSPTTPEDDLLGLFREHVRLEAVLIGEKGPRVDGLVGIATTWDIARLGKPAE